MTKVNEYLNIKMKNINKPNYIYLKICYMGNSIPKGFICNIWIFFLMECQIKI